jgi:transcription antitermination factor NusG
MKPGAIALAKIQHLRAVGLVRQQRIRWRVTSPVPADPAWFAVWTRSRFEPRVMTQLHEKQIEAFFPTITRWSRWKDRKKRIDWPLFPGYCFVRISPEDALAVQKCTGVVRILTDQGVLAAVPDREIEAIRTLVTSGMACDPCPLIASGEVVEVVSGPLKGVTGRLTRKGAHARLVLAVSVLGLGVSIQVDAADVRPY